MQRLIILLLLTLTLIPTAYSFNDNKRVIDIYQEKLEDLRLTHAKLNRLSDEEVKKAAELQQLITRYQETLETTTTGIEDKYQALLKQQLADIKDKYQAHIEQLTSEHAETEAAYLKKLESTVDLADHHYQTARKTDTQIKSLLTELGQSAEQILKLTQLISTLQQQISAQQQQISALRQQISTQQQQEISALQQQISALQQEVQYNRNSILERGAIRNFSGHTNAVYSVAFSADGRYALSGSDDKTLKLWDVSVGLSSLVE